REFVRPAAQVLAQLAFGEGAESAFEITDVGVIDVARDDVGDHVAIGGVAQLVGGRAYRRKFVPAAAKQPHDLGFTERGAGLCSCQDGWDFAGNRQTSETNITVGKWSTNAGEPFIAARPAIGVD